MSYGLIRNLVFARAMSVAPLARALWPDPLERSAGPFAGSSDRWRETVERAQQTGCARETDESETFNHRGALK